MCSGRPQGRRGRLIEARSLAMTVCVGHPKSCRTPGADRYRLSDGLEASIGKFSNGVWGRFCRGLG
jgi:hypothetical protein